MKFEGATNETCLQTKEERKWGMTMEQQIKYPLLFLVLCSNLQVPKYPFYMVLRPPPLPPLPRISKLCCLIFLATLPLPKFPKHPKAQLKVNNVLLQIVKFNLLTLLKFMLNNWWI